TARSRSGPRVAWPKLSGDSRSFEIDRSPHKPRVVRPGHWYLGAAPRRPPTPRRSQGVSPTIDNAPPEELEDVQAGRLPPRYGYRMQDVFLQRLRPLLVPGVQILDVGAGRSPTLAPSDRPPNCRYLGLDISGEELRAAGSTAYDTTYVHDIVTPLPELRNLDVIISWQVLEHVSSLPAALTSLHSMLRPGGTLLAQLSGSFAVFALAARVIPHSVRVKAMARYIGHAEEQKFPTHYDHGHAGAI